MINGRKHELFFDFWRHSAAIQCSAFISPPPPPLPVAKHAFFETSRLVALRNKLGWPEQGIDNYIRDQGIDSGTSRAKGYLSELGWRQGETQSYGEEDEY